MTDQEIKQKFHNSTRTKDGKVLNGFDDLDEVLERYKYFKLWLKETCPDFTEEEIIKFHRKSSQIKNIYSWHNVSEFLSVLELENKSKI